MEQWKLNNNSGWARVVEKDHRKYLSLKLQLIELECKTPQSVKDSIKEKFGIPEFWTNQPQSRSTIVNPITLLANLGNNIINYATMNAHKGGIVGWFALQNKSLQVALMWATVITVIGVVAEVFYGIGRLFS